ncbi:hypothetical protein BH24GEM2_BH24GEM2_13840 [soil metagenome]
MSAPIGKLRRVLQEARGTGISMSDLTVLAAQNDPYRVDTAAGHRDGAWLAEQMQRALGGRTRLHQRGIHYAIVAQGDVLKPNGEPYRKNDKDWEWLQSCAAKAARWLGYVPFDAISDNRNDPPIIHRKEASEPHAYLEVGVHVSIPDASEIEPTVGVAGFEGRQPYHLVFFGEKSSLADVLLPIARQYEADVYLPTGEISDTLMYQMASDAAADGRPMRVFTLADCDPAGHQMPISISRKLQALRDLYFHDLDFEVRSVALTVEQVRDLNLPSTPLKETELRAGRWITAFGVEQTEIDALATLQPHVLGQIVRDAIKGFYDAGLQRRVWRAREDWEARAQAQLTGTLDADFLDRLRTEAAATLVNLQQEIDTLNESLRQSVPDSVFVPPIEIPESEVNESLHGLPLVSSRWPWAEQTRALIQRKAYEAGSLPEAA